jgi:hypothetical protein
MNKYVLSLLIILLSFLAFVRPIINDEAFYSSCINEMLSGKMPYVDYYFHQMPLMLLVYSPVFSFNSYWSLIAARIFSYLLYLVSLYLIYKYLAVYKDRHSKGIFVLFFLCFLFILLWVFIIKTYMLSFFLLICGCVMLNNFFKTDNNNKKALVYLGISGFLFTLLFMSRIVYGVFLLILFIFAAYSSSKKGLSLFKTFASIVLGIVPPLLIFFLIYRNNLYDVYLNVIYINDLIKSDVVFNFQETFSYYLFVFLFRHGFIFFLIIIIAGLKFTLIEIFYLAGIILSFIIHIFTQMFNEYLIPVFPLIVLLAYNKFPHFKDKALRFLKWKESTFRVCFVIMFIFISLGSVDHLRFYLTPNIQGHICESPVEQLKLSSMLNNVEGNTILPSWEFYAFWSNKQLLVQNGFISIFLYKHKNKLKTTLSINSDDDYKNFIKNRIPDIVLLDTLNPGYLKYLDHDISENYHKVLQKEKILVFTRKKRFTLNDSVNYPAVYSFIPE